MYFIIQIYVFLHILFLYTIMQKLVLYFKVLKAFQKSMNLF